MFTTAFAELAELFQTPKRRLSVSDGLIIKKEGVNLLFNQ